MVNGHEAAAARVRRFILWWATRDEGVIWTAGPTVTDLTGEPLALTVGDVRTLLEDTSTERVRLAVGDLRTRALEITAAAVEVSNAAAACEAIVDRLAHGELREYGEPGAEALAKAVLDLHDADHDGRPAYCDYPACRIADTLAVPVE